MHVATASDSHYLPHCATLIASLLACTEPNGLHVHLLHPASVNNTDLQQLSRFVDTLGGQLHPHRLEDDLVTDLPTMDRIPTVMWYRTFLPELLPNVERILYLDADTLALESPSPLFALDLREHYLAAVTNVLPPEHASHAAELGLDDSEYFNSGVLLMNLALMRRDDCGARIRAVARTRDLLWPDQDALNLTIGQHRRALHPRWNCMNSLSTYAHAANVFGPGVVREALEKPAIIHFEGPELGKPWHFLSRHPFTDAYRAMRASTPWPLDRPIGKTWPNRVVSLLPASVMYRFITLARVVRARMRQR